MKIPILFLFALTLQFAHAQFPTLIWEYPVGAPAFGSAAADDLDGDGFYEIVFTTYTNDGRAHCLNAEDGSVHWIYDIGGCGDVAPLIYDMNDDGIKDVLINGSCNPTIFCINGETGELLWSKPSGGGDSPPTVADIDLDAKPEVLFGNFQGQIRILNGEDGSTAKIIQADPNYGPLQTAPTLVDVNGDERLDIIAANYFNEDGLFVWAFNYEDGSLLWINESFDPDANLHAYHGGAVADIDNDNKPEYVIGSGAGYVHAINVEDGSDLWKVQIPASNFSALSIADLDDDGELEVIFNNNDYLTFDQRIRVLSGPDGTEEWSYPITFTSFRGMSISDINGNGKLDLISGHFMGMLRVIEPYAGLIWELDLLAYFPPGLPYFSVDQQPLVADFDQNGTADIFVAGGYGTYTPDSLNTGSAFMIEAGMGGCPEWLMFRHDVHRTGYLSPEEVLDACFPSNTTTVAEEKPGLAIYPNPASTQIHIEYQVPHKGRVEVALIDLNGRVVKMLVDVIQSEGLHQADFPNIELRGMYFCEVRVDGVGVSRKKVMLGSL